MTISTFSAAKKICELSGWNVTNLQLQKVLYLSHMVFMGENREPLINGRFEAWDYGPVVPILYHKVKFFGNAPIENIFFGINEAPERERRFLESAWKSLGSKSASELVAITHAPHSAWSDHYQANMKGIEIPNEAILAEYDRRSSQG